MKYLTAAVAILMLGFGACSKSESGKEPRKQNKFSENQPVIKQEQQPILFGKYANRYSHPNTPDRIIVESIEFAGNNFTYKTTQGGGYSGTYTVSDNKVTGIANPDDYDGEVEHTFTIIDSNTLRSEIGIPITSEDGTTFTLKTEYVIWKKE